MNHLEPYVNLVGILGFLFGIVGFGIKVFMGKGPEEVFYHAMHHPQQLPPGENLVQSPLSGTPTARRSWQRLMPPHPWLLALSLLFYFITVSPPSPMDDVLIYILLVLWISGVIMAVIGRNWVWLVVNIVTLGLMVIFFSIFARPKKRVFQPAARMGGPPLPQPVGPLQQPPQLYQPSIQMPENQQMPSWSAILKGPQHILRLDSSPVSIGRGLRNQLILQDPQVSKFHARIYLQGQNHIVIDLGSANGTFVNEQRLLHNTAHPLKVGDRVRFGQAVFTYTVPQYPNAINIR
jgi:hypothetical protein